MTLFCGRETQVFTAASLPLPCCATPRCMHWKWLVHIKSEVALMWIFPEFQKWKKLKSWPHNAATFSNLRSQYVDPLWVEIKSGRIEWEEPWNAMTFFFFFFLHSDGAETYKLGLEDIFTIVKKNVEKKCFKSIQATISDIHVLLHSGSLSNI